MPSKRRKLSLFISRNLSKRTSSSLIVQTGFPTSLADLVVKNRAKFQKRKKYSNSACSLTVRSEFDSDRDCHVTEVESPNQIEEEVRVRVRRRGVGLGLGFWIVNVVAMLVLAFGRKWIVGGISILAFGVWVIQFLGLRVLKRKLVERNVIGRFDFGGRGLVSPIREIGDHQFSEGLNSRSDGSLGMRKFEVDLLSPRSKEKIDMIERELVSRIREIEPENHLNSPKSDRNLENSEGSGVNVAENVIENHDLGNSHKSKRKKLFKKLFKRKNREKKNDKNSSLYLNGSRSRKEEVFIEEGKVGNGDDDAEYSDEEFLSFQDCNEVIEIDTENINSADIRHNGGEIKLKRWRKYVFCIVVLLGLLGGKGLALFLTIAWYLISLCTERVWKKWKIQLID